MRDTTIQRFWERLSGISRFTFETRCGPASQTGWQGVATGEVEIMARDSLIEYYERCFFTPTIGEQMELKNRYRWTLFPDGIHLSHFRRSEPVDLVMLIPSSEYSLAERASHLCGEDCYQLGVELGDTGFDATWRIRGPKKDERIFYCYR